MQISISNIVKGTVIGSAFTAISRYFTRVTQGGAIYEKPLCVESGINSSPLLQQASMLMIPSGYKGGTAYAELPSNGNGDLTWTRASDAWRTNSDGLIQRVPWNLLQYSEMFTNAVWTAGNSTITANTITAPNGTLTADTIASNISIGFETRVRQTVVQNANTTYTLSCYAKKGTVNWFIVRNLAVNSTAGRAWFNLNTGTIGTVNSGLTASIENVGDGWYRCTISGVSNGATNLIDLAPSLSDGVFNATSTGESVYIWGAQLVEGTTAQTYLPTTDRLNFPRLSYMYGSCPSALLEPQRTNLILQSQDFDNASWIKTNVTITANTTTGPDGSTNADKIIATTTNDLHICESSSNSFVSGTTYTFSFYAKKSENDFIQFTASSSLLSTRANFNVSNGTLGTVDAGLTASITSANDGWYRCIVTFTASATGSFRIILCAITTSTAVRFQTFAGNGTSGLFLYGAQLEAGAYPTTYIPTTGSATVTRVADSFSRDNIYTNGLISASGGTWFVELRGNLSLKGDAAGDGIFLQTVGNTDNFRLYSESASSSRIIIYKRVSNVNTLLYTTTTDTTKLAIKWNGSTADIFANGTKVVSATTFTATQMQDFVTSINASPKYIQAMALFPTPLSDTDCAAITSI